MASQSPGRVSVPPVRGHQLTGAASKSYSLASTWEQAAELTDEQLKAIEVINERCSSRPLRAHVVDDMVHAPEVVVDAAQESYVGTLEDATLTNNNQFYKWWSDLETACATEAERKYKEYGQLLNTYLSTCQEIAQKIEETVDFCESLITLHQEVTQKSSSLTHSCEALVQEKDQLQELADVLLEKLKFFNEYDTIASQMHATKSSLDNEHILPMLKRLDECLSYLNTHGQYVDAATYSAKFIQLQSKAMSMVRIKVQQVLKHASQQVQAAIREAAPTAELHRTTSGRLKGPAVPLLPEGAEVSLLYVRFRAAAESSLKGLFQDMGSRGPDTLYGRLLKECQDLYCLSRLQLVSPFVQQRLEVYRNQPTPMLLRHGCEYLMRICQLEVQLCEQFFPGSLESLLEGLHPLVDPLCTLLYDVLRPLVIKLQDIGHLCELIDILQNEILHEEVSHHYGGSVEALRPLLTRILADLRERLIYRCQAFIKEEVAAYKPTPEDANFPERLQKEEEAGNGFSGMNDEDRDDEEDGEGEDGEEREVQVNGEYDMDEGSPDMSSWYPPVRHTLNILSKLYRSVDPSTFAGLAQETISACTSTVQLAGRLVAQRSGPLDAQLYIIKQLLFLREQLVPFEVDFTTTEVDLDFTHMREHMKRIMSGESSLFSLSSSNAMVQMLGRGGPRVMQTRVDSKRDLEKLLKAACEGLIMAVTKLSVSPLLSFITKVTAVRVAAQQSPDQRKPLRTHAFASQDKVVEMVEQVNEALQGPLCDAVTKMKLYLPNSHTRAILFKPIKSNVAEAHGQIANLLHQEYLPEEVAAVPLKDAHQLGALLDALA